MSVIIQGPVSGLSDADQAYIDLAQTTVPDASKLVDSDNLGTAALAATGDFDAAGAAAAAVSGHETAYDHDNIPSVDDAAALTAYQSALATAGAGQVLTASGPGAAAFAAAAGGPSLSDYSNIVVVDAGGNGDHTLLINAVNNAPEGSLICVVSTPAPNASVIAINKSLDIWIWPNVVIDMGGTTTAIGAAGKTVTLRGKFTNGVLKPNGGNVYFDHVIAVMYLDASVTATTLLDIKDSAIVYEDAFGGAARFNNTTVLKIRNSVFDGLTSRGGIFPTSLAVGSIIENSRFSGDTNSVLATGAFANAPFYHCVFDGPVSNVTANAGTANGTNVVF